jgi:hypothetical protein
MAFRWAVVRCGSTRPKNGHRDRSRAAAGEAAAGVVEAVAAAVHAAGKPTRARFARVDSTVTTFP